VTLLMQDTAGNVSEKPFSEEQIDPIQNIED
jgi:hypothetical protein